MEGKLTLLRPADAPADSAAGGARAAELDAATVARAQQGDEAACRALVRRHQQPVFAVIARVLGPRGQLALVPDLAQETFLRVFRQLGRFAPEREGRLSSWILTIAARVALDELKRRRPQVGLGRDAAEEVEARGVGGADATGEPLAEQEAKLQIERALAVMPPGQRAVLLLRVVNELSYEDIARQLDLEVGTVRSRLARARAALWQALSGDET